MTETDAARRLRAALALIYIVDESTCRDGDRLDAALGGGATAIWLRAPGLSGADLYRRAKAVKVRTDAHDRTLLVGDRADVALAVGAAGVQLGTRSPPARRVRPWFDRWLGVSCHGSSDLARAAEEGADYAVLSPVFGVPEKGPPLGPEKFRALLAAFPGPVVALGGIDAANAPSAREAGAAGFAVIRALRDAEDPAETARLLRAVTTA